MRVLFVGLPFVCVVASGCTDNDKPHTEQSPAVTPATARPAVAWPDASRFDERTLTLLARNGTKSDSEIRALVARSPVPVLAPKSVVLAAPSLIVEGDSFALTGRVDAATVSLQGTRSAHRYESVTAAPDNRAARATRGPVAPQENVRTVSWIDHGTAYRADVECADARDERCTNDEFLLSVVGQLTYIGGSGR